MSRRPYRLWMAWLRDVIANPPAGCAEWPGARNKKGYGQTYFSGKLHQAHRAAYILANGPIPDGMLVLHRCKQTPACCNPNHLKLGTHQDNMDDKKTDGTAARLIGIQHGRAKLTDNDIREIRARRASGETLVRIAAAFSVTNSNISAISTRRTWKHVA